MEKTEIKIINTIKSKIFAAISNEIENEETQILIKNKIINPIIGLIYKELYPYIIALIVTILFILLITLLTFIGFVISYVKKL